MKSIKTDIEMYAEIDNDLNSKISSLTPREIRGALAALDLATTELDKRAKDSKDREHLEAILYKRMHSFDATKGARDVTPKTSQIAQA